MEKIDKICACGARFKTPTDTVKECTSCRRKATIKAAVIGKVYNCPHCTNDFQPKTVAQMFCSAICRRRNHAKLSRAAAIVEKSKKCGVCERDFTPNTEESQFVCGLTKYCTERNLIELNKERLIFDENKKEFLKSKA
jgi:hypothetical protein